MLSVWSKTQPEKTKRKFSAWGDTLVPWKNLKGEIFERYYYIFRLDEIKQLFLDNGLNIPLFTIQSANPTGADNIKGLLLGAIKHINKN